MNDENNPVRRHYEPQEAGTDLIAVVERTLAALGDGTLTSAQVAGLDQFHVRSLAATEELADIAAIEADMAVLEAGSGLGGPSRYLAKRSGCTVAGIDLAPSFVAVADMLARRAGLSDRVIYRA